MGEVLVVPGPGRRRTNWTVLVAVPALFRALQLLCCSSGCAPCGRCTGPEESAGEAAAHPLRQGFGTNVLNPKASLTFPSLLPQFVPATSPALTVCALVWFQVVVALLVDRLGRWLRRPRPARGLQAGTGVALTVPGAALLLEPLLP